MAGQFDYHERMGAGNFGEVWLVTDTGLNAERDLKVIPPDKVLNHYCPAKNFARPRISLLINGLSPLWRENDLKMEFAA